MYKATKNWKCTEWPQTELEDLTVKSTLYTLNTWPWNIFIFFSLRSAISEIQGRQKMGNAPNDPKLSLNT